MFDTFASLYSFFDPLPCSTSFLCSVTGIYLRRPYILHRCRFRVLGFSISSLNDCYHHNFHLFPFRPKRPVPSPFPPCACVCYEQQDELKWLAPMAATGVASIAFAPAVALAGLPATAGIALHAAQIASAAVAVPILLFDKRHKDGGEGVDEAIGDAGKSTNLRVLLLILGIGSLIFAWFSCRVLSTQLTLRRVCRRVCVIL